MLEYFLPNFCRRVFSVASYARISEILTYFNSAISCSCGSWKSREIFINTWWGRHCTDICPVKMDSPFGSPPLPEIMTGKVSGSEMPSSLVLPHSGDLYLLLHVLFCKLRIKSGVHFLQEFGNSLFPSYSHAQ